MYSQFILLFLNVQFLPKGFWTEINLALFEIFSGYASVFVGQENILIQYIAEKPFSKPCISVYHL